LIIKFPEDQYSHLVTDFTSSNTCLAVKHPDMFSSVDRTLPCIFDTTKKHFELTLYEMSSGEHAPHSITIYGIRNPNNVGGTGNFKIETRRGSFNVLDFNDNFNQLGFVAAPTNFTSPVVTITSNPQVNLNGTYEIAFTINQEIPTKGSIVVHFPSTLTIYDDFGCTVSITASTCVKLDDFAIKITVHSFFLNFLNSRTLQLLLLVL